MDNCGEIVRNTIHVQYEHARTQCVVRKRVHDAYGTCMGVFENRKRSSKRRSRSIELEKETARENENEEERN